MTRTCWPRVVVLVIGCALLACGGRGLEWEYTIPSALDGSPMRARVRDGGCSGAVRWEQDFVDGTATSGPPTLPPGTYGVELEVLDDACRVVARGCEVVTLPLSESSVRVDVAELASPEPGTCGTDAGVADAGTSDANVDAAPFDAGPIPTFDGGLDAGPSDAGMGEECTTGGDCDCGDACTDGWCVPTRPATVIEAGTYHSCAIAGGLLFCWGKSHSIGELGAGWNSESAVPVRLGSLSTWTDVSVQTRTTCGVAGGVVRCWGSNYTAQAGVDPAVSENLFTPTPITAPPFMAARIAVGGYQSFALDASGQLAGWGNNDHNQVGRPAGITGSPLLPMEIGTDTWLALASGEFFTCGITPAHQLSCWGAGFSSSLGGGAWPGFVTIPEAPVWTNVALGLTHACAWDAEGAIYCWGRGTGASDGALGGGSPTADSSEPVRVGTITAAQAGLSNHTCIVDTSGALWCFGPNESGQLGIGSMATATSPMRVAGERWTQVSAGLHHTCGIRGGGGVYCWGSDVDLQIGNGATETANQLTPVRVCLP